jgi:hypothetical protein
MPEGVTVHPVSGNPIKGARLSLTRLDAEGKPTGETLDFTGVTITPQWQREAADYNETVLGPALKRVTMEVTLKEPNPYLIALLTGQGLPRWYYYRNRIPRPLRNWLKKRMMRDLYGGKRKKARR